LTRRRRAAGVIALLLAIVIAVAWDRLREPDDSLRSRMQSIRTLSGERRIVCADLSARRPLVLLALGQSNAGNHGAAAPSLLPAITMVVDDECVLAADPLPGATGRGASIWRRLPDALAHKGIAGPVVLSVLAVDATSIGDWTDAKSPLRDRLEKRVAMMRRLGLPPALVLWQQGEADALAGRETATYSQGLAILLASLASAGSDAPILLARSTICRGPASPAVRTAIESAANADRRFRLGPDIDVLQGPGFRFDGCHLSDAGLSAAASLWAEQIVAALVRE
jgi:Carbohydrate esterase, sialic acid-specific acetylesterase